MFVRILKAQCLTCILILSFIISIHASAADGKATKNINRKMVKLNLSEALELAVKNSPDIQISYYTVKRAEGFYTSSKALNDVNLYLNNNWSSSENVSTSLFGGGREEVEIKEGVGATVTKGDDYSVSMGFNQTIPTGATWGASLNLSTNESDSIWQNVNPYRSARLTFSISQPLLKGFGFSFDIPQKNIIISQNNLKSNLESFKTSTMNKLYSVIQTYWNLVYAQKNLAVKQQSLDLALDQLKRNKISVEVGSLAPIEIVSAESRVAQAEQEIISAEANLKETQDNLIKMLYLPGKIEGWNFELIAIDEPVTSFQEFDMEEEINIALENQPTLKQALIDIDSKELEVKSSSWGLLPDVTLEASTTYKGTGGNFLIYDDPNPFNTNRKVIGSIPVSFGDAFDQISEAMFVDWSVGLNVSFPLFNLQARGQHAQNKADLTIAKVNLIKTRHGVVANVRKAVRDIETYRLQIKASEKARILSEKQLEAEQKKFDVGSSTNFQVLEYQKQLEDARITELQARIAYNQALYNLQLQTGTLLERNNIHIDPLAEDE